MTEGTGSWVGIINVGLGIMISVVAFPMSFAFGWFTFVPGAVSLVAILAGLRLKFSSSQSYQKLLLFNIILLLLQILVILGFIGLIVVFALGMASFVGLNSSP